MTRLVPPSFRNAFLGFALALAVACAPDQTPPPAPVNLIQTSVTDTTASLAWTPGTGNPPASSFHVY
ncbi:MAG TPA: hypothetical protein VHN99_04585, partial [Deinococcales bacterium]|nr:hypothetical protein [Deinococcales bacterium]